MSGVAHWLTFFLLNAAWQLVALLLLVACLIRLLPGLSNLLQHRLWVSCLLLAIVLPGLSASLALSPATRRASTLRSDDPLRWKIPQPPPRAPLTLHLTEISSHRAISPPANILISLYLGFVLFGFGRLLLRLNRTRRIIHRASGRDLDPASRILFERCRRLYQARPFAPARSAALLVSTDLAGPATVTWPAPIVLVPPFFSSLAESEATAVLAHELAHVYRHDFEINLALEALAILLLIHPATPWLKRRIAESREIVCDQLAAQATAGPSAYARSLVSLAHSTAGWPSTRASMSLSLTGSTNLERRIVKLIENPRPASQSRRRMLNTLCLSALTTASMAAVLLSLHPSPVHAAPSFPFDPSQTFDSLTPGPNRKPAPDFTLIDNHGKTITLSDYKGKVVLLDFWATWCGGCKLEIPWYMEFDRQYRQAGLAVIGVSMDEKGWAAVRPFLAKKKDDETGGVIAMQYPVVIGNDALASRFGLTSLPMTLLIDRNGNIALAHTGVVDRENFESSLRALLR